MAAGTGDGGAKERPRKPQQPVEPVAQKQPTFSRDLTVGYGDRGMGRGDYLIISKIGEETNVIANLVDIGIKGRRIREEDINPVKANAFLFAAAPELYDACADAVVQFRVMKELADVNVDDTVVDLIDRLEAALAKANPYDQSSSRSRAADYTADDIEPDDNAAD